MYNLTMEVTTGIEKIIELTSASWNFLKEHKEEIEVTSLYTAGIIAGVASLLPIDISPNDRTLLRALQGGLMGYGYFRMEHFKKNESK